MATEVRALVTSLFAHTNIYAKRSRPYLPSLRSTAARIIDPATGASTWALGSQRCVINIGIFTRKAMMDISHQIAVSLGEFSPYII